jgi:polysaccharide export outer membrane protein
MAVAAVALGTGCARHVYRAACLPKELLAPSVVNMEAINLGGLSNPSDTLQRIQCGDVLDVTMVTDFARLTTNTTPIRVADDRAAAIPLIGKVAVAGMTMEEAERAIALEGVARGVFRTPCVTVTMKEQRKNRITVVGAVKKPGLYELPRGSSSLLAALVAADGLGKEAGPEVEIRRTGIAADTIKVNLAPAEEGSQGNCPLEDGDVVCVAKRAVKPFYVLGLVRKPGEFEFPGNQELRVLDALALAGGCSNQAADNVLVIRQLPGQPEPARIALGIQGAKSGQDNLQLAPGDTVIVEQTSATVVVDVLQNFFRFGFTSAIPML